MFSIHYVHCYFSESSDVKRLNEVSDNLVKMMMKFVIHKLWSNTLHPSGIRERAHNMGRAFGTLLGLVGQITSTSVSYHYRGSPNLALSEIMKQLEKNKDFATTHYDSIREYFRNIDGNWDFSADEVKTLMQLDTLTTSCEDLLKSNPKTSSDIMNVEALWASAAIIHWVLLLQIRSSLSMPELQDIFQNLNDTLVVMQTNKFMTGNADFVKIDGTESLTKLITFFAMDKLSVEIDIIGRLASFSKATEQGHKHVKVVSDNLRVFIYNLFNDMCTTMVSETEPYRLILANIVPQNFETCQRFISLARLIEMGFFSKIAHETTTMATSGFGVRLSNNEILASIEEKGIPLTALASVGSLIEHLTVGKDPNISAYLTELSNTLLHNQSYESVPVSIVTDFHRLQMDVLNINFWNYFVKATILVDTFFKEKYLGASLRQYMSYINNYSVSKQQLFGKVTETIEMDPVIQYSGLDKSLSAITVEKTLGSSAAATYLNVDKLIAKGSYLGFCDSLLSSTRDLRNQLDQKVIQLRQVIDNIKKSVKFGKDNRRLTIPMLLNPDLDYELKLSLLYMSNLPDVLLHIPELKKETVDTPFLINLPQQMCVTSVDTRHEVMMETFLDYEVPGREVPNPDGGYTKRYIYDFTTWLATNFSSDHQATSGFLIETSIVMPSSYSILLTQVLPHMDVLVLPYSEITNDSDIAFVPTDETGKETFPNIVLSKFMRSIYNLARLDEKETMREVAYFESEIFSFERGKLTNAYLLFQRKMRELENLLNNKQNFSALPYDSVSLPRILGNREAIADICYRFDKTSFRFVELNKADTLPEQDLELLQMARLKESQLQFNTTQEMLNFLEDSINQEVFNSYMEQEIMSPGLVAYNSCLSSTEKLKIQAEIAQKLADFCAKISI